MARLTGDELLQFVELHKADMDANDLAIGTGYFTNVKTDDGGERQQVNRSKFQAALLAAKGVELFDRPAAVGRTLSYRIHSHPKTGNVVIGGAYLRAIGIEPGQYIRVEPVEGAEELVIVLHEDQTPRETAADEADEAEAPKAKKKPKAALEPVADDALAAA